MSFQIDRGGVRYDEKRLCIVVCRACGFNSWPRVWNGVEHGSPGAGFQEFQFAGGRSEPVPGQVREQPEMQGLDLRQAQHHPGAESQVLAEIRGTCQPAEQLLRLRDKVANDCLQAVW